MATAVPLLQFIVSHPATERQYVQEATDLLAQVGVAVEAGWAERPLPDLIADVLSQIEIFGRG